MKKRTVLGLVALMIATPIGSALYPSSIVEAQPVAGAGGVIIQSPQAARLSPASAAINSIIDKYNGGRTPIFIPLTPEQLPRVLVALDAAYQAGFRGEELITVVSIAGRESNWNPRSHNNNARTRDNSYGLWQINMRGSLGPGRRRMFGISSNDALFHPPTAAKAAKVMYDSHVAHGQSGFHGWGPYKGKPPLGTAAKYVKAVYELADLYNYLAPLLVAGMTGSDVERLQRQLNEVDWRVCGESIKCLRKYRITVDGDFGDETRQAVLMFQRDQGLRCDGVVGPATRDKLNDPSGGWKGCN